MVYLHSRNFMNIASSGFNAAKHHPISSLQHRVVLILPVHHPISSLQHCYYFQKRTCNVLYIEHSGKVTFLVSFQHF